MSINLLQNHELHYELFQNSGIRTVHISENVQYLQTCSKVNIHSQRSVLIQPRTSLGKSAVSWTFTSTSVPSNWNLSSTRCLDLRVPRMRRSVFGYALGLLTACLLRSKPEWFHHTSLFPELVLGCINADLSHEIIIFNHFSKSTRSAHFCITRNSKFWGKIFKIYQKFQTVFKQFSNILNVKISFKITNYITNFSKILGFEPCTYLKMFNIFRHAQKWIFTRNNRCWYNRERA